MRRSRDALGLLTTADGADAIAALISDPGGSVLATDFDGTLAPIVSDPTTARPAAGAVDALSRLAGRLRRVVVVTGRPAATAVALGGLDRVPGILVLGLYGAERYADGDLTQAHAAPRLDGARRVIESVVRRHPGATIEDKGATFVVHTRPAADPASTLAAVAPQVAAAAASAGLTVSPGRFALEVHGLAGDKGSALDGIASELDARSLVFCGDDLGDLAAFETVRRRRAAGVPGLTVASRSDEAPTVADDADLVVEGPAGVVDFLQRLLAALD